MARNIEKSGITAGHMAREQFETCPQCGIGKMKPLGRAVTSRDPNTNMMTTDYREYKCDNCGHPQGGKWIVSQVNDQERIGEETVNTRTITRDRANSDSTASKDM